MSETKGPPFVREEIAHIVHGLRARDRREIYALRWDDDPDKLINEILVTAGAMWRIFCHEAEPVAMAGVVPVRPNVVIAGAFGTELWPKVVRPVTRFALTWTIPRLQRAGYHRAETYALAANIDSHGWLATLGAQQEAYLKGYGRDQEDFILFTWRLQDVHGRRQQVIRAANGHANPFHRTKCSN